MAKARFLVSALTISAFLAGCDQTSITDPLGDPSPPTLARSSQPLATLPLATAYPGTKTAGQAIVCIDVSNPPGTASFDITVQRASSSDQSATSVTVAPGQCKVVFNRSSSDVSLALVVIKEATKGNAKNQFDRVTIDDDQGGVVTHSATVATLAVNANHGAVATYSNSRNPAQVPDTAVIISADTRVVDSTQASLISTDAERASGLYKFTVNSGSFAPEPGNIIVGDQGGGFLRRVVSVSQNGNVIVVQTAFASLDEAVLQGSFQLQTPATASTSRGVSSNLQLSMASASSFTECAQFDGFAIVLSHCIVYDQAGARFEIPSARVGLDPRWDIGGSFSFRHGVTAFHSIFETSLVASVDLIASTTAKVEFLKSDTLFVVRNLPDIRGAIGTIPIVVKPTIAFVLEEKVDYQDTSAVTAGFSDVLSLKAGVKYENSDWSPIFNASNTFESHGPDITSTISLSARVALKPVLYLDFYHSGTNVRAEVIPYLQYKGFADLVARQYTDTLVAGLNAAFGAHVQIVGKALADFSTDELEGPRKILAARTVVFGTTRDVKSVSLSPSTLELKIGETSQLVFEALDADGATVVGPVPTYSSSDATVAVVNTDGLVQGMKAGSAKIVATLGSFADTTTVTVSNTSEPPGTGSCIPLSIPQMAGPGRIAFLDARETGFGISSINSDGTSRVPVTGILYGFNSSNSVGVKPSWSPDGSKIAYTRYTSSGPTPGQDIYISNADGTGEVQLTQTAGNEGWVAWSPDGMKIAFVVEEPSIAPGSGGSTVATIHVINVDGSGDHRVTPLLMPGNHDLAFGVTNPSWSPNSQQLVFDSGEGNSSALWSINVDGTGVIPLTGDGDPTYNQVDEFPSWSPDGCRVLFRRTRSGPEQSGLGELWIVDFTSNVTERLIDPPFSEDVRHLGWSPDGRKVVFTMGTLVSSHVYTANADGSNLTQVTSGVEAVFRPDWGPRRP